MIWLLSFLKTFIVVVLLQIFDDSEQLSKLWTNV